MRLTATRVAVLCSVLLILLLASRSRVAGLGAQDAEIRKTVEQFCAWDFDGARLGSRNEHFKDAAGLLYGQGDWPDEPIGVVSGYRIVGVHARGTHGKAAVQYRLLAELRGGLETNGLVAAPRRETVWLPVSRVGGKWKLDASQLSPHVSAEAMRSHIAQIRRDEEEAGDHHRQELLGTLISELGKLTSEPVPGRDLKPAPNQN